MGSNPTAARRVTGEIRPAFQIADMIAEAAAIDSAEDQRAGTGDDASHAPWRIRRPSASG